MHTGAKGDLLPLRAQPRPGGGVSVLRGLPGVRERGGVKRRAVTLYIFSTKTMTGRSLGDK